MDWTTLFQTILPYLPAKTAGDIVSILTFLIAAAALAMRFWKPPASGSKLALLYKAVAALAQSRGWNTNAYQPGAKALMIPADASRTIEAAKLGLDPASTHPRTGEPPKPTARSEGGRPPPVRPISRRPLRRFFYVWRHHA